MPRKDCTVLYVSYFANLGFKILGQHSKTRNYAFFNNFLQLEYCRTLLAPHVICIAVIQAVMPFFLMFLQLCAQSHVEQELQN